MSELLEVVLRAKMQGLTKLDMHCMTREDIEELKDKGYNVSITETIKFGDSFRASLVIDLTE
jgi:hypothetical protein